jgi:hypothetical protein
MIQSSLQIIIISLKPPLPESSYMALIYNPDVEALAYGQSQSFGWAFFAAPFFQASRNTPKEGIPDTGIRAAAASNNSLSFAPALMAPMICMVVDSTSCCDAVIAA